MEVDNPCAVTCPICKCSGRENWVSIGCGHVFHAQCVMQWNERNQTCPICRQPTTQQTTPLYMNFEDCQGSDRPMQDVEMVLNQRKEITNLKAELQQLLDECGSKQLKIDQQQQQLIAAKQEMQTEVHNVNVWKARFEQESRSNNCKKLFDDITDREIQNILKQLEAGHCSEFICKEKQRTREQYRKLMKKYEELQKHNQKLEINLVQEQLKLQKLAKEQKQEREKDDNLIDLSGSDQLQQQVKKFSLDHKKRRIQEIHNPGTAENINKKSNNQQNNNKLVGKVQKENQYQGDEDFEGFGKKQNNGSRAQKISALNLTLKPTFSFVKDQTKKPSTSSSFYSQYKKIKRSHQETLDTFMKST
eukprot:TRINITY_DN21633_c0_g1_i1.p1 TRINITY_DN21633_c0_g1~~TRINITY_DN21633_c0_g1_i1.p1  ORF type:complete len:361 (+),score=50.86 TRINITY_DN21633_c0_g1_i1:115-1197(+)